MEVGPIDMLMSMVFSKEIDPWNIDIVELTNRYLEQMRRLKELDLRLSGKTILVAAILLRMQSEEFFKEKKEEEEEEEDLDFEPVVILPPLRRKSGKITLPEILEALLIVLEEKEKKKSKPPREEEKSFIRVDIYKTDVRKYVEELYQKIRKMKPPITFRDLLEEDSIIHICRVFLYLLYLELNKRIELIQEEPFGPIQVVLLK